MPAQPAALTRREQRGPQDPAAIVRSAGDEPRRCHPWPGGSQLGASDDAPVELLHRMAGDIAASCGHTLLKAHRLAWGWTVAQARAAYLGQAPEHELAGAPETD